MLRLSFVLIQVALNVDQESDALKNTNAIKDIVRTMGCLENLVIFIVDRMGIFH